MLAPRRGETPFEYMISLWPAAPLFGVPWRFEALMPTAPFFRPTEVAAQMADASAREAAKVVEESANKAVETAEAMARSVAEAAEATAEALTAAAEAAGDAPVASERPQVGEKPAALFDAAPAQPDDLKRLRGVGPKLEATLNALGVWRFDQLATFSEANLAWLDAQIGGLRARAVREDWAAQARALL